MWKSLLTALASVASVTIKGNAQESRALLADVLSVTDRLSVATRTAGVKDVKLDVVVRH